MLDMINMKNKKVLINNIFTYQYLYFHELYFYEFKKSKANWTYKFVPISRPLSSISNFSL